MSSIGGILSTAATALRTHQKALAVTAHNISNAQTPGYTRQRPDLQANYPLSTPEGMIGTGVRLAGVERLREPLLDDVFRRESSAMSEFTERASQLDGIQKTFGEPSDTGLLATLDAFWNSWSDLAMDPQSDSARSVLRERAIQLGDRFGQVVDGLDDQRAGGEKRLEQLLERTNQLAAHIADLNGRITSAESGGHVAGDLRDARDIALDELATLVETQVVHRSDGTVGVFIDGQALVDGTTHRLLSRVESGTGLAGVAFPDTTVPIGSAGGRVGALVGVLRTATPSRPAGELAATRDAILTLAAELVTEVNAIHATGTPPAGPAAAGGFFKPDLEGGRPVVTDEIAGDIDYIAAGSGDPVTGEYLAGTTDVARTIEKLRARSVDPADPLTADGEPTSPLPSYGERYSTIVVAIGSQVAGARSSAQVHDTLARSADIRRDEVSGVSIDEELTAMIQQQAAYGAAARVITRVDEMLQTLLGIA